MDNANRFLEPAGAMNVLTVGSLAHGEGLNADLAKEVRVRPITAEARAFSLLPHWTRLGGATKPDLVDIGGTLIFDPTVARLRDGSDVMSAGVLTLHHAFLDRLFTAGSGTSYAAPRVAFSAAQVLARLPNSSANLVRALLVNSSAVPDAARERLQVLGADAIRNVCGHGHVDLERALFSDDARVVLYAQDELEIDHFAVFRIPVPEVFCSEAGERSIRVILAYDPAGSGTPAPTIPDRYELSANTRL